MVVKRLVSHGLLVVLAFRGGVRAGEAASPHGDSGVLSVKETLELIHMTFERAPAWFWSKCRRANPSARAEMYKMLRAAKPGSRTPAVAQFFGHVGQEDDVEKLCDFLHSHSGVLNRSERSTVNAIFGALGVMSSRGVPGAIEELRKMIFPQYWTNARFSLFRGQPRGTLAFENEMAYNALLGYAWTLSPDLDERVRAVLATIEDEEQKSLMMRQSKGLAEYARALRSRVSREGLWLGPKAVAGRRLSSGASAGGGAVCPDTVTTVISEAIDAYENTTEAVMAGQYKALAKMLADNGEPLLLPKENTEQALDRLAQRLRRPTMGVARTKSLLEALAGCKVAYGPAQVEWTTEMKVRERARNAGEYEGLDRDEQIVVRLPLLGSEAVVEKRLPVILIDWRLTIDRRTRQLMVYMIKKDGQWFWNPFKW